MPLESGLQKINNWKNLHNTDEHSTLFLKEKEGVYYFYERRFNQWNHSRNDSIFK